MLNRKHFKHNMIRKTVIAFGSMFDSIYCIRWDANGNELSRERVHFEYAPKMKWEQRNAKDPGATLQYKNRSSSMSFELAGVRYNPQRKLDPIHYTSKLASGTSYNRQYTPVPYDMDFVLYIRGQTTDDANQIFEQIAPFFTPDYVVQINAVDEMDTDVKIPFVLNAVNFSDSFDGSFEEERETIWTLNFTAKSFIFGPVGSSKKINNTITSLGFLAGDGTKQKVETIHGFPQTDPAKPVADITEEDLWGYEFRIVEATEPPKTVNDFVP